MLSPAVPKNPIVAFYGFRGGEGGISHVILNLMNAMIDFGVEVHLLLNATDIPELIRVRPEIKVFRLGNGNGLKRILLLARYLKGAKPDALLANRERANRTAILARMLSGAPVKIVIRVGMAISKALERRSWLKRTLRRWAIVFCYRRADVVIANAGGVARDIEDITGLTPDRICVLENPTVSMELLQEARESNEHPWFAPDQPPVIIGVGRLAKQKDFPTLLKAFSFLRAERDCRLLILGEGKERDSLEKLAVELGIKQDIDLVGFVPNPFKYMSRAALFVLSSAWEGSPNVLIQALALGVPSVSTDCPGGAREILADGKYGSLVPVGDPQALFEAMRSGLDAPLSGTVLRAGVERFRSESCARAYLLAMGLG
jgi:glycosyltransferase involved in cell wall biosynthesis